MMGKRFGILGSLAIVVVALGVVGCSNDDDDGAAEVLRIVAVSVPPAESGPGEEVEATVEVTTESGQPRAGVEVVVSVELGGGAVGEEQSDLAVVATDDLGRASLRWTTGIAPVANQVSAGIERGFVAFDTRVVLEEPLDSAEFGDIPGFLRDNGYTTVDGEGAEVFLASTEDLAFVSNDTDDTLLLGLSAGTTAVAGGLIAMNAAGEASLVELDGDPLIGTLGVAVDREGVLWVADPRGGDVGALVRISSDGVAETVITSTGEVDLIGPNYVAIGPDDGMVYVSDPCLGVVLRYDPETDSVDGVLTTDVATQGGPNGLAFDPSGENLYFATESIALLCGRPDLELVDPVAGLFRVPVDAAGFGTTEPIAERRGLFGDGLAFDIEGNLYVIFDTEANFMLAESAVWVLPAGETELVKFLANNGERVYANLAWGRGQFGDRTMYIALLAVDAFGLPVRGVERIDLGIKGLPLL